MSEAEEDQQLAEIARSAKHARIRNIRVLLYGEDDEKVESEDELEDEELRTFVMNMTIELRRLQEEERDNDVLKDAREKLADLKKPYTRRRKELKSYIDTATRMMRSRTED